MTAATCQLRAGGWLFNGWCDRKSRPNFKVLASQQLWDLDGPKYFLLREDAEVRIETRDYVMMSRVIEEVIVSLPSLYL